MMYLTEAARAGLQYLLSLEQVPSDVAIGVDRDGTIAAQCRTQDEVQRFRGAFRGVRWRKRYDADLQWWEYDGTADGRCIRIYACREAPPTCRAIVETVEVEERVPVAFETRKVQCERIVRWECDGKAETP